MELSTVDTILADENAGMVDVSVSFINAAVNAQDRETSARINYLERQREQAFKDGDALIAETITTILSAIRRRKKWDTKSPEFISLIGANLTSKEYDEAGDVILSIIKTRKTYSDIYGFTLLYKLGFIRGQRQERARRHKLLP
jgi:hypothetical protein